MQKKGFTLVELLAVIVIMGLLLIIIVPSINNLQKQNKRQAYELYAKSAIPAAKLYVEDKKESFSLHYNWTTNCYIPITYQQLVAADLLKPYSDRRYDCSHLTVAVYQRSGKTMNYAYQLTCYDTQKGNAEVYNESTFKGGIGVCATK